MLAYDVVTKKVLFLKPICIFKGKNQSPLAEQQQYDRGVAIFFQQKIVVDSDMMIKDLLPLCADKHQGIDGASF